MTPMTRLSGMMSEVRGVIGAATGNARGTWTGFPNVKEGLVEMDRKTN